VEAGGAHRAIGRDAILSAAQRRVVDVVQVGYPPARYQGVCSATDPDCLQVSTSLTDDDTAAVVSAKVSVPLRFLNLFDQDLAVIEHSSTRVLERAAFQ
jgi:hypothetical protein